MPYFMRFVMLLVMTCLTGVALGSPVADESRCPTIAVTDANDRARLLHHICYLKGRPGEAAWQASTPDQLPASADWTSANGHDLVFAHSDTTYWFRLNVHNPSDRAGLWYLKLNYALLDEVTFWTSGRDETHRLVTGDQQPFFTRGIDYRYFLLPVTLEAGEASTILLRVRSSGALNVPLELTTPDRLIADSNHLTLTHGLFYGALLIVAILNLLLFITSGTAYYFFNMFYLVAMGLFMFAMGGFANQYFWPDSPRFANTSVPFFMGMSVLAMTLFGRSFLEVDASQGLASRALSLQSLGSLVIMALAFVLPYSQSISLNTVFSLLVIANLFVIGLIRWRQGYTHAKWYVLAWSLMVLGTLIFALAAFGYLADFLAREVMMQAAIGGQVVLLNYAMVQRWRVLNQKLLEVEHSAKIQLELQVHQRTAQLRDAMRDLEQANRKLADLSLNDSLTGLRNRRYLDQMVPDLCAESRRTGSPLTMVLVDADHFKRLNDNWGHSFGDLCLQRIADMLTRHVRRPRDIVARFGGEEFALVLPDTTPEGARKVIEDILADTAGTPVSTTGGETVTMTLSAGLTCLQPGDSASDLFRRADEALYRAKAAGRNRVEIAGCGQPA